MQFFVSSFYLLCNVDKFYSIWTRNFVVVLVSLALSSLIRLRIFYIFTYLLVLKHVFIFTSIFHLETLLPTVCK